MSGRIPELLENLKVEFESMAHDVNMFKMQRDECDRKIQNQLGELTSIQNTLYDLERAHNKIKRDYEEEILRLRRQLGEAGVSALPASSSGDSGAAKASGGSNGTSGSAAAGSGPASVAASPAPAAATTPGGAGPGAFFGSDAAKRPPGPPPAPFSVAATNAAASSAAGLKRGREDPFYAGAGGPGAPFLNLLASGASALEPLKGAHPPASPAAVKSDKGAKDGDDKAADKRRRAGVSGDEKERATSPTSTPAASTMATEMTGRQVSGGPGADWIVGYNPQVQTNLNIDLAHSIDHPSVVCCVRFSGDGKYLATGCNRSAQVYDVQSGEKLHVFTDENAKEGDLYIRSVCFSPDGKYLAAGAEDKTVKLWDIATKRLAQTFVGHDLDIYSLDFSADERFIVSGSGDKKAKLWDVEKGKCLYTLGNDEVGPKDGVTSVALSPDGRLIAAGSLDRIVRLWDATTGYFLERYEGHLDSVYSVAFSPDGKTLASGSLDKTLKLWDLSSTRSRSRCRSTFNGHKDFVLSVAFSADGNWLVSGSKDRSVQFWDPRTAVTHMMLQGHRNSVISVALNPKGGTFATGSGDCRARMWKFDSCFPQGP